MRYTGAPHFSFLLLHFTFDPNIACWQKEYIYIITWQHYIVSDKEILLGKPTIKGTRISVELILELLQNGWTEKQILESYPNLSSDSLRAVFAYLKDCLQQELYFSISA
jgi:uncharacterized protein (DUF433 family)